MRKTLLFTALLGAALAYGTGCGDGGGSGGGDGGGGTNTGGTTTTSTTNTGGTNTGGDETGGTNTGGTNTGGTSTGGTGGTGGTTTTTNNLINGCDPATAEDHTADATTTVAAQGFNYSPPCIKIKGGSAVKFVSNFSAHPLVGGLIVNGAKQPDADTPITMISSGMEVTYTFPDAGQFGYYCNIHGPGGMMGAVFVQ